MNRICALTGQQFLVSDFEQQLCEQNDLPLPEISPFERLRQLSAFRSRIFLNQRICALTGKRILSCFPPTAPHTVVDTEVWESDIWDPLSYGRDYDFSRPFFPQLAELFLLVPVPNLAIVKSSIENSDYTNGITGAKNCYLLFGSSFNEDCLYSILVNHSKNIIDCALVWHSELCYGCVNIQRCYNLHHSVHCTDCSDSGFLYNCMNCRNCFGCSNLVRREYCYYNEQLSPEEYQRRLSEKDLGSFAALQREKDFFTKNNTSVPLKHFFGLNFENCSGNFLSNSKNCLNSYFCDKSEDLDWCVWLNGGKSSAFHFAYSNGSELIYNSVTVGDQSYDVKYCAECWPGAQNMTYSLYCGRGSSHCFGSIGLRKKSYCILNKEYSKSEYEGLKSRIIAHMKSTGEYGKFFPNWMTPFPYNGSDGHCFLPLAKEDALARGFSWNDQEPIVASAPTFIAPDHVQDVNYDALGKELVCSSTGKRYRIIKAELDFLQRNNLAIPRIAPMERIKRMTWIQQLSPTRQAKCQNCADRTPTTYRAEQPVYCASCYESLVL